MAGVTIGWSSGEACGVALGTSGSSMNAGQWEACGGMIEVRIQPVVGVVAHRAVNRILLSFMVLGSVILDLVASDAIRWGIEYRSLMARGALGNSVVSAGQFKASRGMVKGRGLPSNWSVARFALNW